MSEEKKSKFKIKWADREVEYYGDEAKAAYDDLIAHVKSVPIQGATLTPSQALPTTTPSPQPSVAGNRELERVSRDSGIPIEQLRQLLEFRQHEGLSELVPFLPRRLEEAADATLMICYALQVGLQQQQLQILYVKQVMSEVNGYQLPGNRFGRILEQFGNRNWTITAQTGGRYRPFSLSADGGLEAARGVLQRLLRGS